MLGNQDLTNNTPRQYPAGKEVASGKGVASDYKTLERLRQSCRVSLERYTDVAGQSTGHLVTVPPGSFDPLRRANLALLKQREEKAHEAYVKARAALMDFLLGEEAAVNAL